MLDRSFVPYKFDPELKSTNPLGVNVNRVVSRPEDQQFMHFYPNNAGCFVERRVTKKSENGLK